MVDLRSRESESSERHPEPHLCKPISKDEIRETLKKRANRKVEECLGEEGLEWLT